MNIKRSFYTMLISVLLAFLVGCSGSFSKNGSGFDESKDSSYYLSQVEASSGEAKTNWQLLAIRALIKENKLSQANTLLSKLSTDLNPEQKIDKILSQGEIAVRTGKRFKLDTLSIEELNNSQLYRYYSIKLALDKKNINAQAHDYIELEKWSSKDQRQQVLSSTWNFFSKLRSDQMDKIAVGTNETTLQGWIELSIAYQTTTLVGASDNENLKQAFHDWAIRYPNHPGNGVISMLTGEQTLNVDNEGKKVALLLPLSGTSHIFGETIRQGYFDAMKFYPQEPQQNIVTFDTASASLDKLIQQAKDKDVELIVGPLLKGDVNYIKQLAPGIPVLALNKVENKSDTRNKMCYFALSPEDEAKDAANHIFAQNKLKPLLLVPQNELGKRVAQNFAKQWSQLSVNSSPAYVQYFGNAKTLSDSMNKNVGIELVGEPIVLNDMPSESMSLVDNFTDFDAIYIYSSYDELTLIKPMLDMGADKPIGHSSSASVALYSSSKSHVANASNDFYYDLNQTQYAEIPLISNQLDTSIELPDSIKKDYSLMRVYAMGIDAWRLANRFNQLSSNQTNFLDGMTGKLSTSEQCEITRALSWQQYSNSSTKSEPISE